MQNLDEGTSRETTGSEMIKCCLGGREKAHEEEMR